MQTLQTLLDGPACSGAFSPKHASGSFDHESPPLRIPPALSMPPDGITTRASMPIPPPDPSSSTCFLSMAAHCTCRVNISAAFKHAPAMPYAIPRAYAGVRSKAGAHMLSACAARTRLPPSHLA